MLSKMNQMPEDLVEVWFSTLLEKWIAIHEHSELAGYGDTEQEALEALHNQMEAAEPVELSP